MTLRETIEKMKKSSKSEETFNVMIESMKNRAERGLIEGVTISDINKVLNEMDNQNAKPISINEKEEIIGMIAELNTACEKHKDLTEEQELTDEAFEKVTLYEFYNDCHKIIFNEGLRDKLYDTKERFDMWKEENPDTYAGYAALAGGAGAVGAASPFIIDTSRRHALRKAAMDAAVNDATKEYALKLADYNGGKLSDMPVAPNATEVSQQAKAAFDAQNPSLIKRIGDKLGQGGGAVIDWFKANPYLGAGIGGAAALAGGGLLYLAIKKAIARKKRMLKENSEGDIMKLEESIFTLDTLYNVKDIINDMPSTVLESVYANSSDLTKLVIEEASKLESVTLDEEAFEQISLYEFYRDCKKFVLNEDDDDWTYGANTNRLTSGQKAVLAGVGGTAAGIGGTAAAKQIADRHIARKAAIDKAVNNAKVGYEDQLAKHKLDLVQYNKLRANDNDRLLKPKIMGDEPTPPVEPDYTQIANDARAAYNAENPNIFSRIGDGISTGFTNFKNWASANPLLAVGGGLALGAGVAGLSALAIKKIRDARRRRQQNLLAENTVAYDTIFSESTLSEVRSIIFEMPDSMLESLYDNGNEITQELIFEATEFSNKKNSINESVTYVNGNGQVMTKSIESYRKDITSPVQKQTYQTKTSNSRSKKRDYKLLDENLENYKKLSDMTLDEILREADSL